MKFDFSKYIGFDWDEGNIEKNWSKHRVSYKECEEIFLKIPLIISIDKSHSVREIRLRALGTTGADRLLFVIFTIRKNKIRIISARDQNKKERKYFYD